MNSASSPTGNGAAGRVPISSCQNRSSRPLRSSRATMQTGMGRSPAPPRYSKSHAQISTNGRSSSIGGAPRRLFAALKDDDQAMLVSELSNRLIDLVEGERPQERHQVDSFRGR